MAGSPTGGSAGKAGPLARLTAGSTMGIQEAEEAVIPGDLKGGHVLVALTLFLHRRLAL
jgi:hypothetical protein